MKTIIILSVLFLNSGVGAFCQVGISPDNRAPDPSAALDLNFNNKGLLPPRVTSSQRNGIVAPALGLLIFNIDCNDMQYFNGAGWLPLGNAGALATPGAINGSITPCNSATGLTYSVAEVAGATGYHWTVPPGTLITNGQGTRTVTVAFGSISGMIGVAAYNDCYKSNMSCQPITLMQGSPVSVSITGAIHPDCNNPDYTFIANPVNGGANPTYQWSLNGINVPGATDATFVAGNMNRVECQLTSSSLCVSGRSVVSNFINAGRCESVIYGEPIQLFCDFTWGCSNPDATFFWSNSSGSWTSSLRDPIINPGEEGYATDVFYLVINYAPPLGGFNQGVYFTEVSRP